ncbi:MAG: helix-turn-helix domain-containing protein, partial [Clostridia bacterium]|nr:helix-turn-helix domain-containing protein [Clostridia bacterium]
MNKLYKSGEDYLEAVLFIERKKGRVKSIDVANYLGVSRPSVNRALTNLQEMGYVSKPIYGEVTITEEGRKRREDEANKTVPQRHLV